MKNNKLLGVSLVLVFAVIVGGAAFYLLQDWSFDQASGSEEASIDEVNAQSFDAEEMTTNLRSGEFVRATYRIQLDSEEAAQEIEKRNFQLNHAILTTLADTEADEVQGEEGLVAVEEAIREKLNEEMQDGAVVNVYTTSWVVQ
ncbi:flagellar basal body-associated protein FliL [Shouchella shacheensis]|uniref:flagellar basal body-associated protein FliL n=1 Tax=Shouchella shacheensis TaxID=1649580 RepID=UPI00073FE734|nr:flagellar basal body-associated protein FliL [Shouchella shacheensis]